MSAGDYAPVAQLDRVFGYEPKGQGFESLRAHHLIGKWLNLVEHVVWDHEVAGSNPVFPTICNKVLFYKAFFNERFYISPKLEFYFNFSTLRLLYLYLLSKY